MRVSGPRGEILGACGSGETHRSAIRSHRSALALRTGAARELSNGRKWNRQKSFDEAADDDSRPLTDDKAETDSGEWRRPASPRPLSGERGDFFPPSGGEEARVRRWARERGATGGLARPGGARHLPRMQRSSEEFGCRAVQRESPGRRATTRIRARPSPAWLRQHPHRCSLAGP